MSKMHKVVLRNSFHDTSAVVLVPDNIKDQASAWELLQEQANDGGSTERRRLNRVRRALCPIRDCKCGGLRPAA